MQQFIDKLISRLEGESYLTTNDDGETDKFSVQVVELKDIKEIVNQLAEEHKGGWIPVTERLPELKEGTECFKQSALCLVTEEWWDGDKSIAVGWYNQSGVWSNDSSNCKVIAWMPLPEPFQKDGE